MSNLSNTAKQGLMEHFWSNDYIQKAFDMRDLLVQVRKVIGLRSASQGLINQIT